MVKCRRLVTVSPIAQRLPGRALELRATGAVHESDSKRKSTTALTAKTIARRSGISVSRRTSLKWARSVSLSGRSNKNSEGRCQ